MKLVSDKVLFCMGDIGTRMNDEKFRLVLEAVHHTVRTRLQEITTPQSIIIWNTRQFGSGTWFYQAITVDGRRYGI